MKPELSYKPETLSTGDRLLIKPLKESKKERKKGKYQETFSIQSAQGKSR